MFSSGKCNGLTLSEVLIALAILAIIAVFVLPKLLSPETKLQRRHSKAMDTLGTLSQVTQEYIRQNNGCLGPNVSCRVNPATGTPLDGLDNHSYGGYNNAAYLAFQQHLENRLKYVYRQPDPWGNNRYYLPTGVTVLVEEIMPMRARNGVWEMGIKGFMALDKKPEDVPLMNYSVHGVDTHVAYFMIGQSGATVAGSGPLVCICASWTLGSVNAFDWPYRPGDTCAVIGGFNCNAP